MAESKKRYRRPTVIMSDKEADNAPPQMRRKPGRPPIGAQNNGQLSVSIHLLHRGWLACGAAFDILPPGPEKTAMRKFIKELYERVGDAIDDPSALRKRGPRGRPHRFAFLISWPSGQKELVTSRQVAAELLGVKASTLSVQLSTKGGHYSRAHTWDPVAGVMDRVFCEAVPLEEAEQGLEALLAKRRLIKARAKQGLGLELTRADIGKKYKYRRKPTNPENADARDEHIENE